jgi:hypothetical protein
LHVRYSSPLWLYIILLHFSHDRPSWFFPSFSSITFQNLPPRSDLLFEVYNIQHHTKQSRTGEKLHDDVFCTLHYSLNIIRLLHKKDELDLTFIRMRKTVKNALAYKILTIINSWMKEWIWGDSDAESKIKGLFRAVTYEDVCLAEQSQHGHR